jgi:hypothetical protein
MRLHVALAAGLAALGGAGCGGASGGGSAPPCSAPARAEIAQQAGTTAARVTALRFVDPTGAPTCRFAVARPPILVLAGIDTAPQAYERLDREAVEYSQNVLWSHRAGAYPQTIAGLGLAADWFPADRRLLVTDGTRLVTITVTWPGAGAGAGPPRRLAEALARGYLAGR